MTSIVFLLQLNTILSWWEGIQYKGICYEKGHTSGEGKKAILEYFWGELGPEKG